MAEIILCIGKVCSGKTTFSNYLQKEKNFIAFCADDWMLHFYEENESRIIFEKQLFKCKDMIHKISLQILNSKINVVHDFGYWKKSERINEKNFTKNLGIK